MTETIAHFKDESLDLLAELGNVAQFVSFDPSMRQRYSRIVGSRRNKKYADPSAAVLRLLEQSPERQVNIRSFLPDQPRSHAFHYGVSKVEEVVSLLRSLSSEGLFTIVNETVDLSDGGVSGVYLGDVIEFAPGETPRCVEGPDVAELPRSLGERLLSVAYGFRPEVRWNPSSRIEFSLHPVRRGYRRAHTILWEREVVETSPIEARIRWPNKFSRLIGDKAFGLLVAWCLGLRVPRTRVIPRGLPDFAFGQKTRTGERYLRTAPREQNPGKFTTQRGWLDPFVLVHSEDSLGMNLASILSQDAVEAHYSGALVTDADGSKTIEGVRGGGESFMLGAVAPEVIPPKVASAVESVYERAAKVLGPVRMEWVFDGRNAWVVQLHAGSSPSRGRVIYPGKPSKWIHFAVSDGLERLRHLVERVDMKGKGIVLSGRVGITSHMADILRRARLPSRLEDPVGV